MLYICNYLVAEARKFFNVRSLYKNQHIDLYNILTYVFHVYTNI